MIRAGFSDCAVYEECDLSYIYVSNIADMILLECGFVQKKIPGIPSGKLT